MVGLCGAPAHNQYSWEALTWGLGVGAAPLLWSSVAGRARVSVCVGAAVSFTYTHTYRDALSTRGQGLTLTPSGVLSDVNMDPTHPRRLVYVSKNWHLYADTISDKTLWDIYIAKYGVGGSLGK